MMPEYILRQIGNDVHRDITYGTGAETLSEMLEMLDNFLRVCGYCYEGELDIREVDDEQSEHPIRG